MFVETHRATVIRNPGHVFARPSWVDHTNGAPGEVIDELAVLWESEEVATNIAISDGEKLIAHPCVATEGISIEAVELFVTITIDVPSGDTKRIAVRGVDDGVVLIYEALSIPCEDAIWKTIASNGKCVVAIAAGVKNGHPVAKHRGIGDKRIGFIMKHALLYPVFWVEGCLILRLDPHQLCHHHRSRCLPRQHRHRRLHPYQNPLGQRALHARSHRGLCRLCRSRAR